MGGDGRSDMSGRYAASLYAYMWLCTISGIEWGKYLQGEGEGPGKVGGRGTDIYLLLIGNILKSQSNQN